MAALTKRDITALRNADYLVVTFRAERNLETSSVVAVKSKSSTSNTPVKSDGEHSLEGNVSCRRTEEPGDRNCSALVYLYRSPITPAASAFSLVRAGDEITFEFYPDAHTNLNLSRAGIHGDALSLIIRRPSKAGTRTLVFEIASSACPENSARMCRGVPFSELHRETPQTDARAYA